MIGRKVTKEELKVGSWYIAGDGASSCWQVLDHEGNGAYTPFLIKSLNRVGEVGKMTSLCGRKTTNCSCGDLNRLYEWIPDDKPQSSLQKTMSSVIDFFQNLGVSAEEKLLKKHGVEDPIGTPTAKGLELSALISYKANRAEIIKLVKEMDEEEKKSEAKK